MMGTEDVEVRLSLAETYVLLAVLDCLAARGPVDTPQWLTVRIDQREIYGNRVSAMCERMAGLLQRRLHATGTGQEPGTVTPHSDAADLRSALFALEQERDDAVDLGLRTSLLAVAAEHPVALDAGDVAATVQILRTAGSSDRHVPAPDHLRLAAASAARVVNNRARAALDRLDRRLHFAEPTIPDDRRQLRTFARSRQPLPRRLVTGVASGVRPPTFRPGDGVRVVPTPRQRRGATSSC